MGKLFTRAGVIYAVLWLALLAPMVGTVVAGLTAVNPIEYILRGLGLWGFRLLVLGLAITPAARIFKQPGLIRYRRTVGLFAFAYIVTHLLTYVVLDQFFDWRQIGADILKRPFITIGMAAFVALIPLAVTSTNWAIRRLGPVRWKRIHSLIYIIVPAGLVHYWLMTKADHRSQIVYGVVIAALLGWRVWDRIQSAQRRKARAKA